MKSVIRVGLLSLLTLAMSGNVSRCEAGIIPWMYNVIFGTGPMVRPAYYGGYGGGYGRGYSSMYAPMGYQSMAYSASYAPASYAPASYYQPVSYAMPAWGWSGYSPAYSVGYGASYDGCSSYGTSDCGCNSCGYTHCGGCGSCGGCSNGGCGTSGCDGCAVAPASINTGTNTGTNSIPNNTVRPRTYGTPPYNQDPSRPNGGVTTPNDPSDFTRPSRDNGAPLNNIKFSPSDQAPAVQPLNLPSKVARTTTVRHGRMFAEARFPTLQIARIPVLPTTADPTQIATNE